jgi:predicted Zn-dependent protease
MNGNNISVEVGANSTLSLTGSGDSVSSTGPGADITLGGNGKDSWQSGVIDQVNATNAQVHLLDNTNANVYDSGATVTMGNYATVGVYGSGLTAICNGIGGGFWIGSNGMASSGSLTDIVQGTPGVLNIVDNSNVSAFVNNISIALGSNVNFGGYGQGLAIQGNSTDNGWVGQNGTDGPVDTIDIGTGTVAVADNSHVDVNGSGAGTVLVGANDELGVNADGGSFSVNGDNSFLYDYGDNGSVTLSGQYDVGASYGFATTWDMYGFGGEANLLGTYSGANLLAAQLQVLLENSTDTATVYPAAGEPRIYQGSGVYTLDYRHVVMGFAGSRENVSSTLAQSGGDDPDLAAGLREVEAAISANASQVRTGTIFDHPVITWSIDDDNSLFSGKLNPTDVDAVRAALATWARTSGLKFEQVTGTAPADIEIGLGRFGTASSGVVGLTDVTSDSKGHIQQAVIRVEDPSETTLDASALYAGTSATFTQVLTHEVGHALGLGDNASSTSVECYFLDGSNRAPNQVDAGAIKSLYWNVTGHQGPYVSDDVKAAMATMASFAPSAGASAVHVPGIVSIDPAPQHTMTAALDIGAEPPAVSIVGLHGSGFSAVMDHTMA